jgi:hypothetical protein
VSDIGERGDMCLDIGGDPRARPLVLLGGAGKGRPIPCMTGVRGLTSENVFEN